jgi:hypothetical protein
MRQGVGCSWQGLWLLLRRLLLLLPLLLLPLLLLPQTDDR